MSVHDRHDEERDPQHRSVATHATQGDPAQTRDPEPAPKPSQAEGDRETIDQDLRDKEAAGEL
jgi:hypothetical protein